MSTTAAQPRWPTQADLDALDNTASLPVISDAETSQQMSVLSEPHDIKFRDRLLSNLRRLSGSTDSNPRGSH